MLPQASITATLVCMVNRASQFARDGWGRQ